MSFEESEEDIIARIEHKLQNLSVSPEERREAEELISRSRRGRQRLREVYQNSRPLDLSHNQAVSQTPADLEKARKNAERERIDALPQEERDKIIAANRAAKSKKRGPARIAEALSPTSQLSSPGPSNAPPKPVAPSVADDEVAALIEAGKKRKAQEALQPPPEPIDEELAALIARGKERKAREEKEKKDEEKKAKNAEKVAKRAEQEAKRKRRENVDAMGEGRGIGREDSLRAAKLASARRALDAAREEGSESESESEEAPSHEQRIAPGPRHQPWLNFAVKDDEPDPTTPPIQSRFQRSPRLQPQRQQPAEEFEAEEDQTTLEQAHNLHQARLAELKRSQAKADAAPEPEMERENEDQIEATKVTARLKTPPPSSS